MHSLDSTTQLITRHWIARVPLFLGIFGVFMSILGLVALRPSLGSFGALFWFLPLCLGYLGIMSVVFGVWWVEQELDCLIVTPTHIASLDQITLFRRSYRHCEFADIQDIRSEIGGFWGTIFGYGTITITTASEEPPIRLDTVPDPEAVAEVLGAWSRRS